MPYDLFCTFSFSRDILHNFPLPMVIIMLLSAWSEDPL